VWDERIISTSSLRTSPVQIVFPGHLSVYPAPWTPRRIIMYAALGVVALTLMGSSGMAVTAHFLRTPLHGWLLSTGPGTPQLFVLSGNPKGAWWRRIFPKKQASIGTEPHCDYPLDRRAVGADIEAEISVGPWWDRSGALYLRSTRDPSHVQLNGVEVAGRQRVVLLDGMAMEKPSRVRFGNYEMTFDA